MINLGRSTHNPHENKWNWSETHPSKYLLPTNFVPKLLRMKSPVSCPRGDETLRVFNVRFSRRSQVSRCAVAMGKARGWRVLQQPCHLRVAVWHEGDGRAKRSDAVAQRQQGAIDVGALDHAHPLVVPQPSSGSRGARRLAAERPNVTRSGRALRGDKRRALPSTRRPACESKSQLGNALNMRPKVEATHVAMVLSLPSPGFKQQTPPTSGRVRGLWPAARMLRAPTTTPQDMTTNTHTHLFLEIQLRMENGDRPWVCSIARRSLYHVTTPT